MIKSSILFLVFFSFISCESIKYRPIITPSEKFKNRKKSIESQLIKDFKEKNILYNSIDFGQEDIVKPKSFFTLDSLYQQKYLLEQKGKKNKELEEKIIIAKANAQSDTNQIYYIEHHVFSCVNNGQKSTFYAEITCNSNDVILTMNIKENYEIPSNLDYYFARWIFNESFVYFDYSINESEVAFYQFYRPVFESKEGKEKEKFLIHILELMEIADDINSLEKASLIEKYLTKKYIGNSLLSGNIDFVSIEESSNEKGEIDNYLINLTITKNSNTKKIEVILDPYLQIIKEQEL